MMVKMIIVFVMNLVLGTLVPTLEEQTSMPVSMSALSEQAEVYGQKQDQILNRIDEKMDSVQKEKGLLEQKLEVLKLKQSQSMKQDQKGSNWLDLFHPSTKELDRIQDLQKQVDSLNDSLKKLAAAKETIQSEMKTTQEILNAFYDNQQQLAENLDLQELHTDEMLEDFSGVISKEHVIQEFEKKQTPENAGGVKGKGLDFDMACPPDTTNVITNSSHELMMPVNGTISAGTWAYPGGGMHLGMDIAAPMFSEVRAPASGMIVYADHPVSSSNGYLGNYCGWPFGGGNTIAMICAVNDELYAVTFCHLSNRFFVQPGMIVNQGDKIALSGNSGNSTGPHTHVEVFRLKVPLSQGVEYFQQNADFSFGCGWDAPATCSQYGCRIRPESVF